MSHPLLWSNLSAWLTVFVLALCAVTDVLIRRVSEVVLVCAGITVLVIHFSWVSVASAALCALLWWLSSPRTAAPGDIEMAALMGLGMGIFALSTMLVGCVLALATKRWWPALSSRWTPEDERRLAPMGVYFAAGALVMVPVAPWLLVETARLTAAIHPEIYGGDG
ncbi:MAG: hypothetical protein K6T30_03170 [Alicyclobacillus sp.]|nr:hypothetical protein [Alicyclobacillus sp.]